MFTNTIDGNNKHRCGQPNLGDLKLSLFREECDHEQKIYKAYSSSVSVLVFSSPASIFFQFSILFVLFVPVVWPSPFISKERKFMTWIRVVNLSEETRECDVQLLFGQFGPIYRIYFLKKK